MNDKTQLKGKEIFFTLTVMIPPLLLLFIPTYATIYIGTDAWAIFILLGIIDVLFTFVITRIILLSKERSLSNVCFDAFGNTVGKILLSVFAILFAFKSMMFFRDSLEFVFMSTYTLEPIYYFAIPMIALLIFGQFQKKTVLTRLTNIIFAILMFTYFFLVVSSVRNFDINRLLPIFDNGVTPLLEALPHFFTWTGNSVFLLVYLEKIKTEKDFKKLVVSGVSVAYAIVIVLVILFIGVFGVISGFVTSSVLEISLFLNTEVFFSNFESLIKIMWVFAIFIRDCVFIFATKECLKDLFKVKKPTALNVALPLLLTVPMMLLFRNEEIYFYYAMGTMSIICGTVQYGAPVVLGLGLERKRLTERSGQ